MNLNVSFWGFLTFVCYALIWGFLSHYWVATHPDSTISKALAFVNP